MKSRTRIVNFAPSISHSVTGMLAVSPTVLHVYIVIVTRSHCMRENNRGPGVLFLNNDMEDG